MKRRIIAFIDHEIGFRLLEKLISSQESAGIELVAAVTTDVNGQLWWPGVAGICRESQIPLHRYCEPFNAAFEYDDVDWYFLLSWKYVIPSALINRPKCGAINLHYSLLPDYRGVYPVNWAIIEGKDKTGVTYHLVNEEIDAGQVLYQKEEPILLNDTARTLQLRLDDLAYELFDEVLDWIVCENGQRTELASRNITKGTYKSRTDFIDSNELDLNRVYRAIDLLNLLRGKTFLPDSKNLYAVDPATGERVYVNIILSSRKRGSL